MSLIYEPKEDSFLLESVVAKYSKNKKVLDMCTGSGILAQKAKPLAKSILAVDINEEAINLVKSKSIKALKSNLFQKVKGKFDLIICNPPYLPKDDREDKESSLATTGGKRGDEFIIKFLKQSNTHLEKDGIILLLVSSLTPMNKINLLLKKLKLKSKVIASKKLFFEKLEVLEIKRLR